ncbi:MAG: hypothetical protein AAF195_00465 [Pseudomonadota bacterium]
MKNNFCSFYHRLLSILIFGVVLFEGLILLTSAASAVPQCVASRYLCYERGTVPISRGISKPEHECYKSRGECARQNDGKCGWTQTKELQECINYASVAKQKCDKTYGQCLQQHINYASVAEQKCYKTYRQCLQQYGGKCQLTQRKCMEDISGAKQKCSKKYIQCTRQYSGKCELPQRKCMEDISVAIDELGKK